MGIKVGSCANCVRVCVTMCALVCLCDRGRWEGEKKSKANWEPGATLGNPGMIAEFKEQLLKRH